VTLALTTSIAPEWPCAASANWRRIVSRRGSRNASPQSPTAQPKTRRVCSLFELSEIHNSGICTAEQPHKVCPTKTNCPSSQARRGSALLHARILRTRCSTWRQPAEAFRASAAAKRSRSAGDLRVGTFGDDSAFGTKKERLIPAVTRSPAQEPSGSALRVAAIYLLRTSNAAALRFPRAT
jgi:hypothetical protein